MTRRATRRNKGRAVSNSNLNFVVTSSVDNAYQPQEIQPSKDQIMRAHFERRMTRRDFIATQTSFDLKYAVPAQPCLRDPKWEPSFPRHDRLRPLRGYCLDNVTILDESEKGANRPRSSSDPVRFEGLVCLLKRYASELKTEYWMKTSVMYPLGPKMMDRIARRRLNLEGRRSKLLVYNDNSSAFLVVQSEPDQQERTIAEIERILGVHRKKAENELISPPNCKYAMLYKNGEEPRLINNANESPIAIISDEPFVQCRSRPAPEAFYTHFLATPVRLTRSMGDPEKRWLQERLERYDLRNKAIRVLEFYTVEDRNAAMEKGKVEHFDTLFCDTAFNMKEPFEQLNMYVQYMMIPKHVECLAVTIANESDKAFAESAFISHQLTINYFKPDGAADCDLRYDPNKKTIVLQHFARHLDSFEAQNWFTRRIAQVNFIPIEKTEKYTERIPGALAAFKRGRSRNIAALIEQELYKIGHLSNIYRPIAEPWTETMQGAMGARFFLHLVKERPDVPWKVSRHNTGPYQREETFTVHFRTVDVGLRFMEHVLEKSYKEAIFRCDLNDRQGPKIIPTYRLSIAISRSVRYALNEKIKELDTRVRHTFSSLSQNGDVIMESEEALYYFGRLFEEWQFGSDEGIIGVMGWNPALVRVFTNRLRRLLEPIEFTSETQYDLFCGVGEVYVKSLPKKYEYRVVVDVDKYSRKIRLLGDCADAAREDLKNYSENKKFIRIKVDIPLCFPHYNNRLRDLLTPQKISELSRALDARLEGNEAKQALKFTGSISQYEKLTVAFGEISSEIFIRETRNREAGEIPNIDCSTCMTPIGIGVDYYRFDCGHVLCRRCTNSLIRTKVDDGQLVISCLVETCQRVISPKEIMHIIFGDSNKVRDFDNDKLQFLINKTKDVIVNSNPNLKPCTTADCLGILEKEEGEVEQPKGCSACKRPYCRICLGDIHEGRTCEDHERLLIPDESIKQWATEAGNKVKQCPNCSMLVEKRAGCNHMECIQCHTHFCWVCLFIAPESGAIYAHMTAEHGGHGGVIINPENEDREMQEILHQQLAIDQAEIQRQERLLDAFFRDDEDLENREFDDDAPIERGGRAREADQRQTPDLFMLNEEVAGGPPPGLRLPEQVPQDPAYIEPPPGLELPPNLRRPSPEPPVRPLPAAHLTRIPDILPQLDPEYYADLTRSEGLLEWINNSETLEEQDEKIAELVQNAHDNNNRNQGTSI